MAEPDYGTRTQRFEWISSYEQPNHSSLRVLNAAMMRFYQQDAVAQNYDRCSEEAKEQRDKHPLFRAILEIVEPGQLIVEFSCGDGHSGRFFISRGARYIGFDLPAGEMPRIRRDVPEALLAAGDGYEAPLVTSSADVVVSLYSLEHLVWPHRYLNEMLRVVHVGGYVALAFPDLVSRSSPMGSVRFGRSPGGLRTKLRTGRWLDAAQHLLERELLYPLRIRALKPSIYEEKQIKFLINTTPLCLVSPYRRDNDAVYFASEEEVALYLKNKGCTICKRSRDVPGAPGGNALVIAQVVEK